MHASEESNSFFNDLDEYVYLPSKAANYLTSQDLKKLEQFDKTHKEFEANWKLYFDSNINIIAQKDKDDCDPSLKSDKDLMNVESSTTSRSPFEVHYPKSSMRTMD